VYLGGSIGHVQQVPRHGAASVDPVNASLTDWDPVVWGAVRAFAFKPTSVFVAGDFTFVGTDEMRHRLAAFRDADPVDLTEHFTPNPSLEVAPNPVGLVSRVRLHLAQPARVRLSVHDVRGRHVTSLLDGTVLSGERWVEWNGRDSSGNPTAAGVYFYRLDDGFRVITRKFVAVR
jgi:hypothetical protein